MNEKTSLRVPNSCSDNRKPVLSPSTSLRINSVEGSKTCPESRRSIQNLKWGGVVAIAVAFTLCGAAAEAQQPKKVTPIGYLATPSLSANAARIEAFRQGLRELGYVEGKNIVIEL